MGKLKKVLGLFLLFAGLAVMAYAFYASFNIFTAEKEPPEVFSFEPENGSVSQTAAGLEGQMQELIRDQLKDTIPSESIFKMLNLISWSIFAFILFFGGAQVAGVGVKLIK